MPGSKDAAPPLTVEEAQARAVAVVRRTGRERVPVRVALGRVLAESIVAPADVPPHDNSAMDGFAVRAEDLRGAPVELAVVGEVAAGHVATRAVGRGDAFAITTGAPLPPGADAVVMVEDTEPSSEARVRVLREVAPRENVRDRGEDVLAGDVLLRPGQTLSPAALAVLATARRAGVHVARRPAVAVLSTGDELREVDEALGPGAIPETNSYALAALIRQAGGIPRVQPLVRDDPTAVRAAIEEASAADLIVSSGGVSVGEHDHVRTVLAELGAELAFWRVNMKPGKPVAVARLGQVPYFGLPGNPVSAMVSFLLFVRPAIRTALGCAQPFDLPRATATLEAPVQVRGERRTYLRAQLSFDQEGLLCARVAPRQGSGVLTSMLGANGLVVVPGGSRELPAGARVQALVFGKLHGPGVS